MLSSTILISSSVKPYNPYPPNKMAGKHQLVYFGFHPTFLTSSASRHSVNINKVDNQELHSLSVL
jgi:hypothetical protein